MERAEDIPQPPPRTALRRGWVLWLVMFVGWTAYGLLYAYQSVEWHVESGEAYSWQHEFRTNLVGMWGWIPLAMFLFWMVERVPIRRGQVLRAKSN